MLPHYLTKLWHHCRCNVASLRHCRLHGRTHARATQKHNAFGTFLTVAEEYNLHIWRSGLINLCCRFKGETKLEPSDRIKIEVKPANGDVVSTLVIEALKLDDKGDIKAVGKNPAGETSASAKLNVIGMCC